MEQWYHPVEEICARKIRLVSVRWEERAGSLKNKTHENRRRAQRAVIHVWWALGCLENKKKLNVSDACSVLSPVLFPFVISVYFQDKQSQRQRNSTQLGWALLGGSTQINPPSPEVVGARKNKETGEKRGMRGRKRQVIEWSSELRRAVNWVNGVAMSCGDDI